MTTLFQESTGLTLLASRDLDVCSSPKTLASLLEAIPYHVVETGNYFEDGLEGCAFVLTHKEGLHDPKMVSFIRGYLDEIVSNLQVIATNSHIILKARPHSPLERMMADQQELKYVNNRLQAMAFQYGGAYQEYRQLQSRKRQLQAHLRDVR